MALCAVCSQSCRKHCQRCGAPLCHLHLPPSARLHCPACPGRYRRIVPPGAAIGPGASQKPGTYGTPGAYYTPSSHPAHQQLEEMTPHEILALFEDLHRRLAAKMARERAYLDRRAARGTHTPTDEAYEADQILEQQLLDLLAQLQTTARAAL